MLRSLACVAVLAGVSLAQKDDPSLRFEVLGNTSERPPGGLGVVLVLPGGDGSAEFRTFVEELSKLAPERMLFVQLIAPDWPKKETLVWPKRSDAKLAPPIVVEDIAARVLAKVAAHTPIDKKRIYTLSWSSGGPAAYALSLEPKLGIRGSLVVMSAFHAKELGPLAAAKDRAYYLVQSPEDDRCKLAFAEAARDALSAAGAKVTLTRYRGGHAWNAEAIAQVGFGLRWLDRQLGVASRGADGDELLRNGSFEDGLSGWTEEGRSKRATISIDATDAADGKRALRIKKTGAMPPDLVSQEVELKETTRELCFAARVACEGAANAWLKLFVTDAAGKDLVSDVDVVRIGGSAEWETFTKRFMLPIGAQMKGRRARVVVMMVGDGVVRIDGVRLVDTRAE